MRLKFLFLFIAFIPFSAYGQGCITILSGTGDRFYLELNGVRQNAEPQTGIRADGLMDAFYNAAIIFAGPGKPALTQHIPIKDMGTGQYMEKTYMIERAPTGGLTLNYTGATPVPTDYTPLASIYYIHNGLHVTGSPNENTIPVSENPGGNGGSVRIGTGGNVNINIASPPANKSETQTEAMTSFYEPAAPAHVANNTPVIRQPDCKTPLDPGSFKAAKEAVAKEKFEDAKFSAATAVLASGCVSTGQVVQLCQLFGFEASKLNFAKLAYPKTTDPANYSKVNTVFEFKASKAALTNFVSGWGK
jgi:hypothetical protein